MRARKACAESVQKERGRSASNM